ERAIHFATTKHTGQTRRDAIMPYIVHPMEVMKTLDDWGVKDVDLLIAAVFHDLIEDTKTSPDEIRNGWGERTLQYVQEVTRMGVDDATIEEKVNFLRSFQYENKSTPGAILKLADRWCNIKDFKKHDKREWFSAYYALQAYPLCTWFYKNIYKDDENCIANMYGLHVQNSIEYVIDECIGGIICKRYPVDVVELIYNRGEYESNHD